MDLEVVLTQNDDYGWKYVVVYGAQSNNTMEANYLSYEEEMLVAVWVVAHFLPYLYGEHFTLVTDHQSL